jgi:hypothetical protein
MRPSAFPFEGVLKLGFCGDAIVSTGRKGARCFLGLLLIDWAENTCQCSGVSGVLGQLTGSCGVVGKLPLVLFVSSFRQRAWHSSPTATVAPYASEPLHVVTRCAYHEYAMQSLDYVPVLALEGTYGAQLQEHLMCPHFSSKQVSHFLPQTNANTPTPGFSPIITWPER